MKSEHILTETVSVIGSGRHNNLGCNVVGCACEPSVKLSEGAQQSSKRLCSSKWRFLAFKVFVRRVAFLYKRNIQVTCVSSGDKLKKMKPRGGQHWTVFSYRRKNACAGNSSGSRSTMAGNF